jgi:hypothetical protein
MNNVTSETNSTEQHSAENAAPDQHGFDAAFSAVRQGAEDAKRAAEKAIPRIKAAASEAAYWTAYGVTFAAIFQWELVKRFTPQPVKSGCQDGVKAGKDAADKLGSQASDKPETPALIGPGVVPGPA